MTNVLLKWRLITFLWCCPITQGVKARHRGCRPGELSNSNVSLTFSCSTSLFSLLCLTCFLFSSSTLLSLSSPPTPTPPNFLSLFCYSSLSPFFFVSYLGSNFHSLSRSLSLSAGKGECRRSFSNWQYTDNCFLVTVTWQGLPG